MVINSFALWPHKDIFTQNHWVNKFRMEVFVEQPQQVFLNFIIGSKITKIKLDGEDFPYLE